MATRRCRNRSINLKDEDDDDVYTAEAVRTIECYTHGTEMTALLPPLVKNAKC